MINLIVTSLCQGLLAAVMSALGMCLTCAWFEWKDRTECDEA